MSMIYLWWGRPNEYAFWLRDGAISEFHHSGGGSLSVFLIQDLQGALFFHSFLSILIGGICGAIAAALGVLAVSMGRGLANLNRPVR